MGYAYYTIYYMSVQNLCILRGTRRMTAIWRRFIQVDRHKSTAQCKLESILYMLFRLISVCVLTPKGWDVLMERGRHLFVSRLAANSNKRQVQLTEI